MRVAYDADAPGVAISGAPATVNSLAPFDVTVTFTEAVSGFDAGDVAVINGAAGNLRGSGAVYTVAITPDGVGDLEIGVAADVAADAAGNGNTAAASVSVAYDATAPGVAISGAPATVNSLAPFDVTVTFSEEVSGFDAGDVAVINGAAGNLRGSGAVYTVAITPDGAGDLEIGVAADVATDAVDNGNTTAASVRVAYDADAPGVAISGAPATVNSLAPFDVTVRFTEDVSGFAAGDVTVANGNAGNLRGSGAAYTVAITPDGAGALEISVAADVATDAAGNGNTAAASVRVAYDADAPGVAISGAPATVNSLASFDVTVTFTEAVSGFDAGDVTVVNGAAGAPVEGGDASTYTVAITPDGVGDLEIGVAADVAADSAGNGNTAAASVSVAYDATAPGVAISGAPPTVNSLAPFDVTVTFTEAVSGFDAGDVAVINGAAGNLRGSGAVYTVAITPDGAGDLEIGVAADVATDAVDNGNTAAASVRVAYDADAPGVAISGAPATVNSLAPFDVTVRFTEDVSGFAAGDVTVANGNAGNLRGSGAAYTVAITPDGAGALEISVAADVATDAAGNGNTAAPSVRVAYDADAPGVAISGAPATVNSLASFDVTVTFTEAVSGFEAGDVTVVNGAAGAPVEGGDASTYTVAITPDGVGDLEIGVAADVATDATGNGNTGAPSVSVAYDADAPGVAISGAPAAVNSQAPFDVTVTFSEEVSGFDAGDVTVVNGAADNLRGSGSQYTVAITPDGTGALEIGIAAGVATDAAGNGNTAAPSVRVAYGATAPGVATGATGAAGEGNTAAPSVDGAHDADAPSVWRLPVHLRCVNSQTPFDVTVTFSEEVSGFDAGDVAVINGAAGNLRGSGAVYTVAITPDGAGDLEIGVAADVAADAAGNGNTAAAAVAVAYDAAAPDVAIADAPNVVNSTAPFDVKVTFTEAVSGFDAGDVTVANGNAGNLRGSGAAYTVAITPDGCGRN